MTVSRVIRETHTVKAETLRKVRAAIRKTGYHPDPALSALAAYRSLGGKGGAGKGSQLAFLDCDGTHYSRIVLEGVKKEASLLGYTVESFRLKPEHKAQAQLNRMLYHRGVRGLLFGPSDEPQIFEGWDWPEFALVSLGALTHQPAMHAVTPDYFHGALSACRLLKAGGCQRIALVLDPRLEARTGHRWTGGYVAGLGSCPKPLFYSTAGWNPDKLKRWIRNESVDGLLTIHGEVWKALCSMPLKMVFLNDQFREHDGVELELDPRHIGAEGVRLLHHSLLRREFGLPAEPKMLALQGVLKDRKAPAQAAKCQ
jgi:hypothetical protein